MAATSTSQCLSQTQTTVNTNQQDVSCFKRAFPCAIYLGMIAFMIMFAGAVNAGIGSTAGSGLSGDIFTGFRQSARRQMHAGIALLVIGVILMMLSIYWCRYAKRSLSNVPVTSFSGTATTTVIAPNTAGVGVVQPPALQGGGNQQVYVYQPHQQAGTFQPVQGGPIHYAPAQPGIGQYPPTQYGIGQPQPVQGGPIHYAPAQPGIGQYPPTQSGIGQYPPAQSGVHQYPPAQQTSQPSDPAEELPDHPPPTYNELTNPVNDTIKSYGNV
ncbi:uncharacterized protein LOC135155831 [Lytechinus pictus]|uniref:uncharacterized protein LOC135155831 n=1 Tax=Lytechinus pictus TaxID=7653 RepID=UPI0030B9E955